MCNAPAESHTRENEVCASWMSEGLLSPRACPQLPLRHAARLELQMVGGLMRPVSIHSNLEPPNSVGLSVRLTNRKPPWDHRGEQRSQ